MKPFTLLGLFGLLLIGRTAAFTKFERCGLLTSDRCFETVLEEIVVNIGPDGTDNDVAIEICSDYDVEDCCKTKTLSRTFRDDWRKNNQERWDEDKLDSCEDKKFRLKNTLHLTLSKEGTDSLVVQNIDLITKSTDKKPEQFRCGPVELGTGKFPANKNTIYCEPSPRFHAIYQATFAISGAKNDGTDDDVFVTVCSDANRDCCKSKLSGILDDWHRGSIETWSRSYFDDKCSESFYKIRKYPQISVSKKGRDSLRLLNVTFDMDVRDRFWDTKPKRLRTFCNDDDAIFDANCVTDDLCSHTFLRCTTQLLDVHPKSKKTIEPKGSSAKATTTTRRPGTTTTTTLRPTTTTQKKSGLLGLLTGKK